MKRFLGFVLLSVCIVLIALGIYNITNKYDIKEWEENVVWQIELKGLEDASSFQVDGEYIYVSFQDKIIVYEKDGREVKIIREDDFNIRDIVYKDNNLYITSGESLYKYNLKDGSKEELLKNIPAIGLNDDTKLLNRGNSLFIAIGSNTNSGIVSNSYEFKDIPTIAWKLTGVNLGEEKTAPFCDYGESKTKGEKVSGKEIGNASIIVFDIKSHKYKLYAHGIRNIEGWDFNSKGELLGIVGGMLDEGVRPVKYDKDYIYLLNENQWYGWPDYSGGDPITSPRFTNDKNIESLISNHPTRITERPLYQHSDVNALKGFIIDEEGQFFEKDSIIFADNKNNVLYNINKDGVRRKILSFKKGSEIEKIVKCDDGIYALDKSLGVIYKINVENENKGLNIPVLFYLAIIGFVIVMLVVVVLKICRYKQNSNQKDK